MNNELIRIVTPLKCPHCAHDVLVCQAFFQPGIAWIISSEEMQSNKTALKELLKSVVFKSKKAEEEAMDEINKPDYMLGAEDIEEVAKSIAKEQRE